MLEHFAKCWQKIVDETNIFNISEKSWKKKNVDYKNVDPKIIATFSKMLTKNYQKRWRKKC
jgi:hypothetical protein